MTYCEDTTAIHCITTPTLGRWVDAWDALVLEALLPSPFLRSWWLESVRDRDSVFLLVLEGERLIGGLALQVQGRLFGVCRYGFVGSGPLCPDHLDALALPGRESAVAQAVVDWFRRPGARLLNLEGLAEFSMLERAFGSAATSVIDIAPWEELPDDPDRFLATRSANLRKTLRRTERRLAELGVTYRRVTVSETEAALAAFVELQRPRIGRDILLAEFPALTPGFIAGVKTGDVLVDVLVQDERIVAVTISFAVGGTVRVYQSARSMSHDLRDASLALLFEVIRSACAAGCREIDLLRGAEPYKMRFAQRSRDVKRLRVGHGVRGNAVLLLINAATDVRCAIGSHRRRRHLNAVSRSIA